MRDLPRAQAPAPPKVFVAAIVCLALAAAAAPPPPATATTATVVAVGQAPRDDATSLRLTSPAFTHQGAIPARYSCEVRGSEVSPPLVWSGVPAGARSLALVVDDPDAPDPQAPQRTWVHWVLYDLPHAVGGLPEGVKPGQLPAGARQGKNDWGRSGYGAPCPPIGRHRYFFKLYALDTVLPDLGAPDEQRLNQAMRGHVLAHAELIGTYQKGA
jgi:Raf kinase inhibitor-like YbhB/YbcL family protein